MCKQLARPFDTRSRTRERSNRKEKWDQIRNSESSHLPIWLVNVGRSDHQHIFFFPLLRFQLRVDGEVSTSPQLDENFVVVLVCSSSGQPRTAPQKPQLSSLTSQFSSLCKIDKNLHNFPHSHHLSLSFSCVTHCLHKASDHAIRLWIAALLLLESRLQSSTSLIDRGKRVDGVECTKPFSLRADNGIETSTRSRGRTIEQNVRFLLAAQSSPLYIQCDHRTFFFLHVKKRKTVLFHFFFLLDDGAAREDQQPRRSEREKGGKRTNEEEKYIETHSQSAKERMFVSTHKVTVDDWNSTKKKE